MPKFEMLETGKGLHGQQGRQGQKTNDEGRWGKTDGRDARPPLTAAALEYYEGDVRPTPGAGDKYWLRRPVACVVEVRGEEIELKHLIGADSKTLMGLVMAALSEADLGALAKADLNSPETLGKGIELLASAPDALNAILGIASGRGAEWAETLTMLELSRVHKEYFKNMEVKETVANFFGAWGSLLS